MAYIGKQPGEMSSRSKVVDIDLKIDVKKDRTLSQVRREIELVDLSKPRHAGQKVASQSHTPRTARQKRVKREKSKLSQALFAICVTIVLGVILACTFIVI